MNETTVKVIKGTLGYRDGLKVIPKTSKDKPFLLESGRAGELARQGIVELVDAELEPQVPEENTGGDETEEEPPGFDPADAVQ